MQCTPAKRYCRPIDISSRGEFACHYLLEYLAPHCACFQLVASIEHFADQSHHEPIVTEFGDWHLTRGLQQFAAQLKEGGFASIAAGRVHDYCLWLLHPRAVAKDRAP